MLNKTQLTRQAIYEVFDRILKLRMQAVPNKQIAQRLDLSEPYVADVLRKARIKGYAFPETQNPYQKIVRTKKPNQVATPTKLTDLSKYSQDIPCTRLYLANPQNQEIEAVTPHFFTTKNFWLFSK